MMTSAFRSVALAIVAVALCAAGIRAQAQPLGYTQDFETFAPCGTSTSTVCPLPAGWTNLSSDNFDWLPDVGGTGSSGTGPAVDHLP
ncbi:MAG: hypothetical protein KDB53_21745, partial [Planctomycetes bacterium]|nr:hypothetical protein [Planctomycetota bacterium]